MLKMEDLKNQGKEELIALYQDLSKEIYGLKCELQVSRKTEKPHLLREKKKDRARVLTTLQQKTGGKV
ncbi:MAG: 50S ribosomal protein L29 [Rhabdochlamydiaceae bacterium]